MCSFLLPDRWEWDSPDTNVTADAPCLLLATWGRGRRGVSRGAHTRYLPLPPREKWGGELSIQVAATRTRAAFNYFLLGCLTHCVIPHKYTILDIKVPFRRVLFTKIISVHKYYGEDTSTKRLCLVDADFNSRRFFRVGCCRLALHY